MEKDRPPSRLAIRRIARTSTSRKRRSKICGRPDDPSAGGRDQGRRPCPPRIRMETYKVLLDAYYPKDRANDRRVPGGTCATAARARAISAREIARRNYGCTPFHRGGAIQRGRSATTTTAATTRRRSSSVFQARRTWNHAADVRETHFTASDATRWRRSRPARIATPDRVILFRHEGPRDAASGRSPTAGIHAPQNWQRSWCKQCTTPSKSRAAILISKPAVFGPPAFHLMRRNPLRSGGPAGQTSAVYFAAKSGIPCRD